MRMVRDRTRVSMAYAEEKYMKGHRADRMLQWFRGDHFNPNSSLSKVLEADRVVVNYSLINVLVKVAQLAFGDPAFRIRARRKAFKDQLKLVQPVLDYVFGETKAMSPIRRALFDCKVTGTGVVGTNWRFETADMVYQGVGADQSQEGVLVYDNPETRRIKPEWWVVDPDSVDDWRNSWYVGEKWQIPLMQMKRNPRYKHVKNKLKGTVRLDQGDKADAQGEVTNDDHLRKVEGYTVYLRDLQCVVDWSEEVMDEPLFVGEIGTHYPTDWGGRPYFPYAMMQNVPDLKTHYGISDVEITETQQAEIDVARSQLANVRRQNNGQILLADNVMDEDALAQFQQGVQNAIIPIKLLPGQKLKDVMDAAPRENIQPEVYASLDKAQMDMSELSRAAAFRRGQTMPGLKYATEAALAAQGVQGLEADERIQFERFVAEVAEQYVNLLHRWAGEMREIETAGGAGTETEWLDWTGQQLAGDFEFSVEQASMNPPDNQLEEQKWAARIATVAPFVGPGVIPLIEAYLESFDFEEIERVIPQQPMGPVPGMPGGPMMGDMTGGQVDLGGNQGLPEGAGGQDEADVSSLLSALSGAQG